MEKSPKWISIKDLWGFKSTFYKLFHQPPKTSCFLWLLCLFYRGDVKSNRGKSLTGLGKAKVDVIESWIFTVFDSQLEGLGSVYIGHIFWSNVILLHILWVTHGKSKETYNKAEKWFIAVSIFLSPLSQSFSSAPYGTIFGTNFMYPSRIWWDTTNNLHTNLCKLPICLLYFIPLV